VAIIEVADTGPGVSERARAHLFEAFQGSTRPGGSGLAIAAELVRAHGGEIRLADGTIGAKGQRFFSAPTRSLKDRVFGKGGPPGILADAPGGTRPPPL
jgi:signal transduction histidine kinase